VKEGSKLGGVADTESHGVAGVTVGVNKVHIRDGGYREGRHHIPRQRK
jgi:hypothetical protein